MDTDFPFQVGLLKYFFTLPNKMAICVSLFYIFLCFIGVEFIRVLTVFDCRYDPNDTRAKVFDGLVLVSFLFAMLALFILIKKQHVSLVYFSRTDLATLRPAFR